MMAYFLAVKKFYVSLDVSTLLPALDTSWDVAVHSYYIATENDDQILRVNCNLVQYDRHLQKPHLLEVITKAAFTRGRPNNWSVEYLVT